MQLSRNLILHVCIIIPLLYCASTRSQQTKAFKFSERISSSIDVLRAADSIPEKTIPDAVLKNAYGLVVIPDVMKGAFILGGRYGKGVISVKMNNGKWSYPGFISIGGGSVGWQWGVESVDLVLVFKNKKSVDSLINGQLTLGASASVAAGPVGRHAEAGTNTQFNAEIYSYALSKGLFIGASLEGSSLGIDEEANKVFYNSDKITLDNIFNNKVQSSPPIAAKFVQAIDSITGKR